MAGRDTSRRFKRSRKGGRRAAATRGRRLRSGAFRGRCRRAGESGYLRKPLGTIRPNCGIWFAFAGESRTYGRAAIRRVASVQRAGSRIFIATPSPIRRTGGRCVRIARVLSASEARPSPAGTQTTLANAICGIPASDSPVPRGVSPSSRRDDWGGRGRPSGNWTHRAEVGYATAWNRS